MQGIEITENRVAVTNVALASLRFAVAQQMEFETLLEDVVKRQEDGFGTETATSEEKDKLGKKASKGDKAENTTGFVSKDPADENLDRGGSVNIKV